MLDNRCVTTTSNDCSCRVRMCVNKVICILGFVLALVVGAIIGSQFAVAVLIALIPLIIFAITLLLAIFLIWFFVRCKCNQDE